MNRTLIQSILRRVSEFWPRGFKIYENEYDSMVTTVSKNSNSTVIKKFVNRFVSGRQSKRSKSVTEK